MNESLISVRYATALFLAAKENNVLSQVKNDVEDVLNIYNQSKDFQRFLNSPVINPSNKLKALEVIFGNKIHELIMNFFTLLIKNNREAFIPIAFRDVLAYIRKESNIKTAVITTAQALDLSTIHKAEETLEKELDTGVELETRINPELIGGMILRIDDNQYDASVSSQLKKLKLELLKTQ